MHTVVPQLNASEPESLPFGRSFEIRAFLLTRERGNVLVYRADTVERDAEAIHRLGGISRQYLNHRHEASPACDRVAETFGAPLLCHADEEADVAGVCNVDHTFSKRHHLDDDLEVIPTPGHTSGATAFDTIFFRDGEWVAAVLDGVSDRERYVESLELIRGLDFDVIVPSVATAGQPPHMLVDRSEAERRIDAIVERVRASRDA